MLRSFVHHVGPQAAQAYTAKLAKRRHYKTLYWEFTRFSKILEYCYYCGNKFYIPSVHRILVCCVHFGHNLRSFRARTPRTVLPYKLYRRLVSSHAICMQADRKVMPTKSSPGATVLPQMPQNQHIHKAQYIVHHISPSQRITSSFDPSKCELSVTKIVSAHLVTSHLDTGWQKSPLGGWGKYFVVAFPHTHCTPQRRSFTNTSHCSNGNFAILRWLSWYYSNKHSSTEATILNNSNLFRHLFISYVVATWFMFFHGKTTSSSFLVRSTSFDYVVTKHFILKSKCK